MDLSIVVINYNTFHLTVNCLKSIFAFSGGIEFEVILVDNASSENDPKKFKELYPQIILIESNENLGFAKGNNLGIRNSQGKHILLLNSDTFFIDESLAYAMFQLKANHDVHVLTGMLTYPDGRIQYQCGRFPSVALQLVEFFRVQKLLNRSLRGKLLMGAFFDHQSIAFPDFIWGTFFLFKREILGIFKDELLPEKYFMYNEDVDWCYKIKRAGYKIMYDPKIKIVHYFSASSCETKEELLRANFIDLIKSNKGLFYYYLFTFFYRLNLGVEEIKSRAIQIFNK